jgi:cbb3-type cytochrome oxidase maturation protein
VNIIFLLIPVSILIAAAFFAAFIWAVKSGQYEDTLTPSMRVLLEDGSATDPDEPGNQGRARRSARAAAPPSSEAPILAEARRVRNDVPCLTAVPSSPFSQPSDS